MIYQGQFADNAGVIHAVRIYTGWSPTYNPANDTVVPITMGKTPFVTTMDSGDDTIYKPMKCTGATIQIVTEDYLFDIYSPTAQGTKVELSIGLGIVEWTGFVTPNLYDMGYQAIDTIDIECIDGLSTLQYIKYTPVGETKAVRSFREIVDHILQQCHCYNGFSVSNNTSLPLLGGTIMDKLYVSENNFFDSKSDENKSDTDVAWTCQEVLEQIAQYLGCSVVANGLGVFFVDYDAVKAGGGSVGWYQYTLGSSAAPSIATTTGLVNIERGLHYDNSASLSIGDVFNKIIVKCNLNDYNDVLPDFFDGATNITKADPNFECPKTTNTSLGDDSSPMYGDVVESRVGNSRSDTNTKMLVFVDVNGKMDNSSTFESPTWLSGVFIKYMSNPNIICHKYRYNGSTWDDVTEDYSQLCYTDTLALSGAFMVKSEILWMRSVLSLSGWNTRAKECSDITKYIKDYTEVEKEEEMSSRLDMDDYILLINPLANQPNYANAATEHMWDTTDYPYVETELQDTAALYGGDNAYYIISGSVLWDGATKNSNYPIDSGQEKIDINRGRKDISQPMAYLRCKLQQGNLWWNGEQWTSTESIFKLYFVKENTDELRSDALMYKELRIVNTVTWDMGLTETGYAIPVSGVLTGTPKLTILNPMDFGGSSGYQARLLALRNFKIRAAIGDPSYSDMMGTDTEYTNVINPDYVSEAQEVEFKVCTWDDKKPNFSCVATKHGNVYSYINRLANAALEDDALSVTYYHGSTGAVSDGTLRAEEWMVLRLTKQYSQPAKVFTVSLKKPMFSISPSTLFTSATLGCSFIVDKMEFDVKRRKSDLKLVEKL